MEGVLALMIPILGILLGFFAVWTNHRQKVAKIEAARSVKTGSNGSAEQEGRVARLDERVQVLERIVTDKGYDLAGQIEALRDDRAADHDSGTSLPQTKEKA
jgi:hypothetical protein